MTEEEFNILSDKLTAKIPEFKRVTLTKDNEFFMSMSSLGELTVSGAGVNIPEEKRAIFGKADFVPSDELRSAIGKLERGEGLTPLEEYAVEAAHHERTHARQIYGYIGEYDRRRRNIMEMATQWTARRTYGETLEAFGGAPAHSEIVKKYGLGYGVKVRGFDTLLEKLGISEDEALRELERIRLTVPKDQYEAALTDWICGRTGFPREGMLQFFNAIGGRK